MAPMPPLGKKRLLELLDDGRRDVTFGSPHQCTWAGEQDGVFRVRELVVDRAEEKAVIAAAIKAGHGYMPENHYALGRPTGKIYLEAKTLAELKQLIEAFDWPKHW